ncbi:hypothetical protein PILCRDRAFT_825260 [Piloderma croceum F 1598]|uniref:Uncharacterized protein n=1 Tax=Piloderma croceum (strain F 1598) TaxID=765440 RepID=A0A0C3FCH3_PILCF|nr:hypothetical protein PILCRDRAFT_825260 [Piloderma croceum F 1598]
MAFFSKFSEFMQAECVSKQPPVLRIELARKIRLILTLEAKVRKIAGTVHVIS